MPILNRKNTDNFVIVSLCVVAIIALIADFSYAMKIPRHKIHLAFSGGWNHLSLDKPNNNFNTGECFHIDDGRRCQVSLIAPYVCAKYNYSQYDLECYFGLSEIVGFGRFGESKTYYQWSIGSAPVEVKPFSYPREGMPFSTTGAGVAWAFGGHKNMNHLIGFGFEAGYRFMPKGDLKVNSVDYRRFIYNPFIAEFRYKAHLDSSGPYISATFSFLPF